MSPQAHGHPPHSAGGQYVPDALEQHNQVQSMLPEPHSPQRRWSHPQHRSVGVLPQPEPEEETRPFILDLKNFPDLANADINSQNPNIQVSPGGGPLVTNPSVCLSVWFGAFVGCASPDPRPVRGHGDAGSHV